VDRRRITAQRMKIRKRITKKRMPQEDERQVDDNINSANDKGTKINQKRAKNRSNKL